MPAKRVLVLQMCRMGDILQTGPALRGLRRAHPEAEVTLVLLDGFASTPIPEHLYDRLVRFPMIPLAAGLVPGSDWRPELERLRGFIRDLGDEPFDLAVNLTQSPLSGLLMAIIPARERRGPFMRSDRRGVVLGSWMQYFWSSVRARVLGCFNLVDLFAWTAGVGRDGDGLELAVPEAAEARIASWLQARGLTDRRLIAVQLGASEESKRWPAERFAAAADLLDAEGGEIVLVGTAAERPLADRFLASTRRTVHDAVGATSLPELGALLRRCRLLLTNDTGTMHVAAAVDTRVVDICTGSVFVHETGPYGLGHVVLEPAIECFPCTAGAQCHHHGCRQRLTPGDVAAAARFAMGEGPAPRPERGRLLTGRRMPSGRLDYWPMDPAQVGPHDIVRRCLADVWEQTLNAPAPQGWTGNGVSAAADAAPIEGAAVDGLVGLAGVFDELARVASAAASTVRAFRKTSGTRQSALADRAHGHLARLVKLADSERACHPFVDHLLIELDAIPTNELQALAGGQIAAYAGAAERARRLAIALRERAAASHPRVARIAS